MRLILHLAGTKYPLPLHYHEFVQAAIYHAMGPRWADHVHNRGFPINGRPFRLFTFSRLMGRYVLSRHHQTITFPEGCMIVISSPVDDLIAAIAQQFLQHSTMQIGDVSLDITRIEGQTVDAVNPAAPLYALETLSPITVHSLTETSEGQRFTQYYPPHDPRFAELLRNNLLRKHRAFTHWTGKLEHLNDSAALEVFPLKVRKHVLRYRQIVIEGYSGTFALSGHPSLIQIGVEAGFGSNNAQGFGCVTPLHVQGGL